MIEIYKNDGKNAYLSVCFGNMGRNTEESVYINAIYAKYLGIKDGNEVNLGIYLEQNILLLKNILKILFRFQS